ncbi:hypothetical protein FY528_20940 [Hymenobacter lutimineralis]|uniref:Uncharacterized protein n=1 Tax=Hymenobacter lutimineralis TaxID=2606448 RepID=A0A5D6UQ39_9BACT|nr:hypothetical protein FY528_20940 [Hymenobacter lutimineralis]
MYSPWNGAWIGIPAQLEYIDPQLVLTPAQVPPDVLDYDCGQLRNTHPDDALQHGNVGTIQDFANANNGLTRSDIIGQRGYQRMGPMISLPYGPSIRYIRDPQNPDVIIDLRHMLVVAYQGPFAGNSIEIIQGMGSEQSAYDHQDYFSNSLGYRFYELYISQIRAQPSSFTSLVVQFLTQPQSQSGASHRTRNNDPNLINQRCP